MKAIFIMLLINMVHISYSQNIIDLAQKLSDTKNRPTTGENFRKAVIKYNNKLDSSLNPFDFRLTLVDLKNGYLEATVPDVEFSICYWNMPNGNKLICYCDWACGPVCGSEWKFYEYSKDKGIQDCEEKIKIDEIITDDEYFDFEKMKIENNDKDFKRLKNEAYLTYNLQLPQSGQNIKLYFEPNLDDGWIADRLRYKVNYKGIELIWKDGNFKKGEWIK